MYRGGYHLTIEGRGAAKIMGEKEISIDFSELHQIEVYCPKCNTGILIDVASTPQMISLACPACRNDLSAHACTAIESYRRFFENAKQSKTIFKFRIKEP